MTEIECDYDNCKAKRAKADDIKGMIDRYARSPRHPDGSLIDILRAIAKRLPE